MGTITLSVPDELKEKMAKTDWINWSSVAREAFVKLELLERLESKEEKELAKWSVELGRKAKKESFKRLVKELSPDMGAKLLSKLSPEKRREYSK